MKLGIRGDHKSLNMIDVLNKIKQDKNKNDAKIRKLMVKKTHNHNAQ